MNSNAAAALCTIRRERGAASLSVSDAPPRVRRALLRSFPRSDGARTPAPDTGAQGAQEHRSTGAQGAQVSERLETGEDGRINDHRNDRGPAAPDHASSGE